MSKKQDAKPGDLEAARELLATLGADKATTALFSTVSESGRPHTAWMFASRSTDPGIEILTITSPDSDKVRNLHANAEAEWLVTSKDRMEQLYLEGKAVVVEDIPEIKRLWNMIGGKERVYFMKYYNSGLGFAIVRTRVSAVVYSRPEEYRKARFTVEEIL